MRRHNAPTSVTLVPLPLNIGVADAAPPDA
jgi:hypothetical protein